MVRGPTLKKLKHVIWRLFGFLISHAPERLRVLMKQTPLVVDMDYPGIKLVMTSETDYGERRLSCQKEPETIKWIEQSMKPGDVLMDIGANVGAYSLVTAKSHQQRVRVYAFEPAAPNYFDLCHNIALNGFGDCICPLPIALSDETKIGVFNYSSLRPGDALHSYGNSVDFEGKDFVPAFRQQILSYRLDDLIREFHLPGPTHIKLDVDGSELKVLYGADQTLSQVRSLIMELADGDTETAQIMAYLSAHGLTYRSRHRSSPGADDRFSKVYNYVFERTVKPASP